jgi:hypothetical protein
MLEYTRKEVFNSDLTDTSIAPCCQSAVDLVSDND